MTEAKAVRCRVLLDDRRRHLLPDGPAHPGGDDTVGDLGWRPGVGTHRIVNVIKDVLEKYDTVPTCEEDVECQDCFNWKFFESNSSDTTTSKTSKPSSTTSQTRTETCKTPGWWGCLDESTTTTPTTTITSTITTSSCKSPGWFGCNDGDPSPSNPPAAGY